MFAKSVKTSGSTWRSTRLIKLQVAEGMFTGIVEAIGSISRIDRSDAGIDLGISLGTYESSRLNLGDSISVNGVCLTVTRIEQGEVDVHLSNETVARTNFGQYSVGQRVNIEQSLTLDKSLGGHLVSGHIDGTAKCTDIVPDGASSRIVFEVPGNTLGKFMAEKGSVAIDGVSMTVNSVSDKKGLTQFEVNVIPHTRLASTLGELKVNHKVHIEIDMLARYVHRLINYNQSA